MPLNILIVGNSIGGPALATFLLSSPLPASQKPHITLLERSPSVRTQGQNIDIRGAGIPLIRKLGLEAAVRASTTGEEGVQFVDASNTTWATFPVNKSANVHSPTAELEIMRGHLARLCYLRSKQVSDNVRQQGGGGISYIFGNHIASLTQTTDAVHVTFAKPPESTKSRSYDLVIGADGLHSSTRNLAFPSSSYHLHKLNMYQAFFSIPSSSSTDTPWRRWFHAPAQKGIMLRPTPTPNRTTAFMYLSSPDPDGSLTLAATPDPHTSRTNPTLQKELMASHFPASLGWELPRILSEMSKTSDFYYDMVAQVKMPKWHTGRVCLVGDAGYCASPVSGMGTTLALTGAYHLAGSILAHPEDAGAAFEMYEKLQRPIVDEAQKLSPLVGLVFGPESAWGVWMLNAFMWFLGWSGLVGLVMRLGGKGGEETKEGKGDRFEEFGFEDLDEFTEDMESEIEKSTSEDEKAVFNN